MVRKVVGPDAGTIYAMKVLKKATLKGIIYIYVYKNFLVLAVSQPPLVYGVLLLSDVKSLLE